MNTVKLSEDIEFILDWIMKPWDNEALWLRVLGVSKVQSRKLVSSAHKCDLWMENTVALMSEEEKLEAVKRVPKFIRYVRNSSEELQMAVITKSPESFSYIKNPTVSVQMIMALSK